jgi:hypothetical protein
LYGWIVHRDTNKVKLQNILTVTQPYIAPVGFVARVQEQILTESAAPACRFLSKTGGVAGRPFPILFATPVGTAPTNFTFKTAF